MNVVEKHVDFNKAKNFLPVDQISKQLKKRETVEPLSLEARNPRDFLYCEILSLEMVN